MSAVHILMALLGLGLPGGFAGLVAKFGLNTVLGGASAYLKKVPRWVWIALAVVVALVVFTIWHQHKAHAALAAARAQQKIADDAAWQAAFAKERRAAQLWQQTASKRLATISNEQRKLNDEANHRIAADARDLLLRGPGKAAATCTGSGAAAGLSAAAGRPQSASAPAHDAGTALPGDDGTADRAIVPWRWLVGRTGQCDAAFDENVRWRTDYQQRGKAWQQLRASAPKAAPPANGPAR